MWDIWHNSFDGEIVAVAGEVKSGQGIISSRGCKSLFQSSLAKLGTRGDGEVTKLPNAQFQDPGFWNLYIATFGISPQNTKYALHARILSTKPVHREGDLDCKILRNSPLVLIITKENG